MPVCCMALVPLAAAAWTDWRARRIPDGCAFLLAVCGVLRAALNGWPVSEAAWGLVLLGGTMLLCALVRPGGLGGGDVKLCAALGVLLGPMDGVLTLLLTFLLIAAWGALRRAESVPLAPFLLPAYLLNLL